MITEILLVVIIALLLYLIIVKKETKTLSDSGLLMKIGELSSNTQGLILNVQNIIDSIQELTVQMKDISETLNKRVGEMNDTLKERCPIRGEFNKISTKHKPVIMTSSQDILTTPHIDESNKYLKQSLLSDKNNIVKGTRIVGGKLRKVETINGEIVRVFDRDGNIIEDRYEKIGDKLKDEKPSL